MNKCVWVCVTLVEGLAQGLIGVSIGVADRDTQTKVETIEIDRVQVIIIQKNRTMKKIFKFYWI